MGNYSFEPPIEGLLCMEPAISYKRVRRANRGLRTNFIPVLTLAGYVNGLTCPEYARTYTQLYSTAYRHLQLAVKYGYLVKRDNSYYLTDSGAKVRQDALNAMTELAAVMRKDFIKAAKAAVKRVK